MVNFLKLLSEPSGAEWANLFDGALSGQNERNLVRVDNVMGAVTDSESNAGNFVAWQLTLLHHHAEALLNGRNESLGDVGAHGLVDKFDLKDKV